MEILGLILFIFAFIAFDEIHEWYLRNVNNYVEFRRIRHKYQKEKKLQELKEKYDHSYNPNETKRDKENKKNLYDT